jgi:hypothetical protein
MRDMIVMRLEIVIRLAERKSISEASISEAEARISEAEARISEARISISEARISEASISEAKARARISEAEAEASISEAKAITRNSNNLELLYYIFRPNKYYNIIIFIYK